MEGFTFFVLKIRLLLDWMLAGDFHSKEGFAVGYFSSLDNKGQLSEFPQPVSAQDCEVFVQTHESICETVHY